MNKIIHAPAPGCYPDKRMNQITLCRLRVYYTEVAENVDREVTCVDCKEEMMKDCEF